jgi:hypothetical protein
MKDEDLFVPPPDNDHAFLREHRRDDCECYGVSQSSKFHVLSSCQNVEDPEDVSENDIT